MTVLPGLSIVLLSNDLQQHAQLETVIDSMRRHQGMLHTEFIVVANDHFAQAREIVGPLSVRYVECENRGYGHGNNVGFEAAHADHILFANCDVEIKDGTLEQLVRSLDKERDVGMIGVRQLNRADEVLPTIGRSPSALRTFGCAIGVGSRTSRLSRLQERVLTEGSYASETDCDWVLGSFLLVRREAFEAAGRFDPSFFLYSEEPDLANRMRAAGWRVRYTPALTIYHDGELKRIEKAREEQRAYARLQYARKHLTPGHQTLIRLALALHYALRLAYSVRRREWRVPAVAALAVVVGLREPSLRSSLSTGHG